MKWALTNFSSWTDSQNTCFVGKSEDLVPSHVLVAAILSKWLAHYAAETRKQDG